LLERLLPLPALLARLLERLLPLPALLARLLERLLPLPALLARLLERLLQLHVVSPAPEHEGQRRQGADEQHDGQGRAAPGPLDRALQPRRRPRRDRLPLEEVAQVVGQGLRGGVALLRVLLQALQADGDEVARQFAL